MSFDAFLYFDGDCRQAVAFYAEVFRVEPTQVMTYGQNPAGAVEADRDRVLYASLPVFGSNLMMADHPTGSTLVRGDNVALTIGGADADEIKRVFAGLAADGRVDMALGPTFFSPLYGMVTDRFGIPWQVALAPETS